MKTMINFFKRINRYLLVNYPSIWCLQIHNLIPIVSISAVVLFLLLRLQNPETYHQDDLMIVGWLYVLSTAGLVMWLVFMFRFNPMKSYGKRMLGDEWVNFIFTFKGVALLTLLPLIFFLSRHSRVHSKFTDKSIITAVNKINMGYALNRGLNSDSVNIYRFDTIRHHHIISELKKGYDGGYDSVYIDVKNDSLLHCYNMQHFIHENWIYEPDSAAESRGLLSAKQIFYHLQKVKSRSDTLRIIHEFNEGLKAFSTWNYSDNFVYEIVKYGEPLNDLYRDSLYPFDYTTFSLQLGRASSLVSENLKAYSIFYWNDWDDIIHGLFYLIFYITLFILLFRNMTLKTFMISIGVGILIPIITALLALAFDFHDDNDGFILIFSVYTLAWLFFGITMPYMRRTLAAGIVLNILMVTTPVLGWFLAEWWIDNYQDQFISYDDINWELIHQVRWYGEVSGMVVFLILLQLLFKKMYVKWYSLPEE